ncbi:hypothetical protein QJU96_04520 [Pasteurella skyensis]|uniref:Uncharacterized protein n=1 Tax=Phocoenobacter skyensis TaxID=97481 RepID=A0AAJ6NDG4_9PAST|nr:hypothetical protein [Pasteurella skyensis]MDP8170552.1 hypothetical protein [Pasteurella skyensis]MDP8174621.1 hypothetical protein [Pasteurella skyensis]
MKIEFKNPETQAEFERLKVSLDTANNALKSVKDEISKLDSEYNKNKAVISALKATIEEQAENAKEKQVNSLNIDIKDFIKLRRENNEAKDKLEYFTVLNEEIEEKSMYLKHIEAFDKYREAEYCRDILLEFTCDKLLDEFSQEYAEKLHLFFYLNDLRTKCNEYDEESDRVRKANNKFISKLLAHSHKTALPKELHIESKPTVQGERLSRMGFEKYLKNKGLTGFKKVFSEFEVKQGANNNE